MPLIWLHHIAAATAYARLALAVYTSSNWVHHYTPTLKIC